MELVVLDSVKLVIRKIKLCAFLASYKNILFNSKNFLIKTSSYFVNGDPSGECVASATDCSSGLVAVPSNANKENPGVN